MNSIDAAAAISRIGPEALPSWAQAALFALCVAGFVAVAVLLWYAWRNR